MIQLCSPRFILPLGFVVGWCVVSSASALRFIIGSRASSAPTLICCSSHASSRATVESMALTCRCTRTFMVFAMFVTFRCLFYFFACFLPYFLLCHRVCGSHSSLYQCSMTSADFGVFLALVPPLLAPAIPRILSIIPPLLLHNIPLVLLSKIQLILPPIPPSLWSLPTNAPGSWTSGISWTSATPWAPWIVWTSWTPLIRPVVCFLMILPCPPSCWLSPPGPR